VERFAYDIHHQRRITPDDGHGPGEANQLIACFPARPASPWLKEAWPGAEPSAEARSP